MLIEKIIDVNAPLTLEQIAEVDALKNRPAIPDEDCPEITAEDWEITKRLMKKYNTRRLTREIYEREGLLSKKKTG